MISPLWFLKSHYSIKQKNNSEHSRIFPLYKFYHTFTFILETPLIFELTWLLNGLYSKTYGLMEFLHIITYNYMYIYKLYTWFLNPIDPLKAHQILGCAIPLIPSRLRRMTIRLVERVGSRESRESVGGHENPLVFYGRKVDVFGRWFFYLLVGFKVNCCWQTLCVLLLVLAT
jgi:hypothetical protein